MLRAQLPVYRGRSPLGAASPDALIFVVRCPTNISGLLVASGVFNMSAPLEHEDQCERENPLAVTAVWPGVVTAQTVGRFTLLHAYVATDLTRLGLWRGYATITMQDTTTWSTTSIEIDCFDPFKNPLLGC